MVDDDGTTARVYSGLGSEGAMCVQGRCSPCVATEMYVHHQATLFLATDTTTVPIALSFFFALLSLLLVIMLLNWLFLARSWHLSVTGAQGAFWSQVLLWRNGEPPGVGRRAIVPQPWCICLL